MVKTKKHALKNIKKNKKTRKRKKSFKKMRLKKIRIKGGFQNENKSKKSSSWIDNIFDFFADLFTWD